MRKRNLTDFNVECFGSTRVGERGQIVIPKKLREKLGVDKGDTFLVMEQNSAIVLAPTKLVQDFITHTTKELRKLAKK